MSNAADKGASMDSEKSKDIRSTNIVAARAVADVVRTSLGPKGMDKMVSIRVGSQLSFRFKTRGVKFSSRMMAPLF